MKARGTQRLIADVLRENTAMRELTMRGAFLLDDATPDNTCLRYVLEVGLA